MDDLRGHAPPGLEEKRRQEPAGNGGRGTGVGIGPVGNSTGKCDLLPPIWLGVNLAPGPFRREEILGASRVQSVGLGCR